jgi:uncharacterized protein with PIN domain
LKFLADAMLGKLSRWLRMLGQNVEYNVKLTDDQLLVQAKAEGRVLLTKDFELYQRALSRGLKRFTYRATQKQKGLQNCPNGLGCRLKSTWTTHIVPGATLNCNPPLKNKSKAT